MRRYNSTKKINDLRTNDQVYGTVKLPQIPVSPNDRYIISREGDRLDLLANQFYGDPRMWILLATANNLGKGSFIIRPGLQIRLPDLNQEELESIFAESEENR